METNMNDCIFCKIIRREIPCHKIYENEDVLAFLDIAGDVWGHTLVIPKKHCVNILDCDDATLASVTAAVKKISRHFVEDCGFDGVDVMNANNAAAQQSVFHLHFHVIPRKEMDGIDVWGFQQKHKFDFVDMCSRLCVKGD